MKTSIKLLTIAALTGLMYLLPLQNSEIFAQRNGRGNGNGFSQSQNRQNNYLSIPGLTADQKQKITNLQTTHQNEMKVLRDEKRSTRVRAEKNAVDEKMTTKINKHKTAVKALLTPEQQKYFDENCMVNKRLQRNKGNRNGRGNGNGNGRGQRKGGRY
ncbi:MAG: hypothetical protein U9R19_10245 [Bacteroidota bacterium]|nr:hypothetical protein [Bacteroidota bacterium]